MVIMSPVAGCPPTAGAVLRSTRARDGGLSPFHRADGCSSREHIGLNTVNPDHYEGWSGPLAACEFAAQKRKRIAPGGGLLLDCFLATGAPFGSRFWDWLTSEVSTKKSLRPNGFSRRVRVAVMVSLLVDVAFVSVSGFSQTAQSA